MSPTLPAPSPLSASGAGTIVLPTGERLEPFFFGAPESALFACLHAPSLDAARGRGVLLVPAQGNEYVRSHRSFRHLGERLARRGVHALRFDFFATGDSVGDEAEARLGRWRADVAAAADELRRRLGRPRIDLVGRRLGATLAFLHASEDAEVDRLVLWDPVVDGAAYLDEIAAVHSEFVSAPRGRYRGAMVEGEGPPPPGPGGSLEVLGNLVPGPLAAEIRALDATALDAAPVDRAMVVDSGEQPVSGPLVDRLADLGCEVEHLHLPEPELWSVEHPLRQAVPNVLVDRVVAWLQRDGGEER